MKELCIDASIAVKLVLKGESHRATARRLVKECLVNNITLISPHLFECEVDSVILRRVSQNRLRAIDAERALAGLGMIPVRTMAHPDLRARAREIALQFNLDAVYDATYAALAELRGCDFWTADKRFFEVVTPHCDFVKYLPNYPN
ncbi:MAG: type II toxin-antitoxin system VapC family toxin [Candidatus Coatesbacteria bacterium]|nr:type II toxin-antitoxin system VapC family toxin [Candidatus Coatesbacteria bacterium]